MSVVICSHNGAATIEAALASLDSQTLGLGAYEVIVVDDGSTDATAETAERRGARVVRLAPAGGLAAARNAGVAAAQAEVIAFTDDDCEADPGWLEALLASFADPDVAGAGGRVVPLCDRPFLQGYYLVHNPLTPLRADLLDAGPTRRLALYLRRTLGGEPEPPEGERLYSVVGANMAFRRSTLRELRGFDEEFSFGGEEEDLCRRALQRPEPARLAYAPRAVIGHRFDTAVGSILRRARGYGRGNARTALKHPEVRPIVFPFPLAVVGLATAGLISRRPRLVALAGLLPLAAYPPGPVHAGRAGSAQVLAYPYIEVSREAFTMIGEVEGWRAGYEPRMS